jgi:polysaccharide export outer membrane protein
MKPNFMLRYLKNFVSGLCMVCLSVGLFPVLSGAQSGAYHIGLRDVLTLVIHAGGEKQNEVSLTVSSMGLVNVPFIGPVKAKGLTVSELEEAIMAPLSADYFVNPEVNIQIAEYHSLRYYISGAVKTPGLYEMAAETTLMELIAKAGGVMPERGKIAYILSGSADDMEEGDRAEQFRPKGEPTKISLKKLLDEGDMSSNPVLNTGAVVYIPLEKVFNQDESKIYVEGEVKQPGIFEYQAGLTALRACIMAGGFDKYAAPNRARIIRKVDGEITVIEIDLIDVQKGKIPDVKLEPGDRVHIPETYL